MRYKSRPSSTLRTYAHTQLWDCFAPTAGDLDGRRHHRVDERDRAGPRAAGGAHRRPPRHDRAALWREFAFSAAPPVASFLKFVFFVFLRWFLF